MYAPSTAFAFSGLPYTPSTVFGSGEQPPVVEPVKRVLSTQSLSVCQEGNFIIAGTQTAINSVDFTQSNRLIDMQQARYNNIVISVMVGVVELNAPQWLVNQQETTWLFNELASLINTVDFAIKQGCFTQQDSSLISDNALSVQDVLQFIIEQSNAAQADMYRRYYTLIKQVSGNANTPYTPSTEFVFNAGSYTPSTVFTFGFFPAVDLCEAVLGGVFSASTNNKTALSDLVQKKLCTLLQNAIKPPYGTSIYIDPPRPPPQPPPSHGATVTILTRQVYTVQHSIEVKTVIGNHSVPLSKVSLSYDVDSFAWVFSGVLADKSSLSLVTMTNDVPVQLSITINSYNWIVLVEKIPETRSFGKTDIALTGRSLSALLGAPYQRLSSYTAGSDMTVQQIADALLPVGWTIDWQCATPWLVPANTFSYTQQTTLQALATIAQNIGAALVPSRNAQVLTMQPRYPVLPWNFNAIGIDPDLVIPDSAIKSIGTESRTQSPINGVYVHGEIGGVLAWCRLTGTAGDVLAATESNALITDVTGARALGERILAGQATQPVTTSFTTFLGGDFVLAEVGQLVAVNGERAIINGVSIDVEFGKVSQQITLGEQTTNAYSKLLNLLPAQPLLVGQLVTSYDDMSILTLLDGGVITARGTGTTGLNYYVRNGLIESVAPNLTLSEVVI